MSSYGSISKQRHRYLVRELVDNRGGDFCPLQSHQELIDQWAFLSSANLHNHCQDLLKLAANPALLMIALSELGRIQVLGESGTDEFTNQIWAWFRDLGKRLLGRTFRRGEYHKVQIPKPGKRGFRTIEVPSDETRIVSRNLSNILTPLLDRSFYPLSIGFRSKRSAMHGLGALDVLLQRGLTHVVACDIKDAFGQLPKQRALQILSSRIHNSPVMWLVEEILDRHRKRGVPQGISISPLMLNVYLDHNLDHWWVANHQETVLIRYADDILIACPSRESAIASYTALRDRIQKIGMEIKEAQGEAVFDLGAGEVVDFLGFRVRLTGDGQMKLSINDTSWEKLEITLAEASHKLVELGEPVEPYHSARIGFGWLMQKAIAIDHAQISSIAGAIRDRGNFFGLDMSMLTDKEAEIDWETGQQQWQKARKDVVGWLPQNGLVH
jgi:retron-type reverse transcriptase